MMCIGMVMCVWACCCDDVYGHGHVGVMMCIGMAMCVVMGL